MQYPGYGPQQKQQYYLNNNMYGDGQGALYASYAFSYQPSPPPPPPPPPPPTHAGTLFFDQFTGQYFYQKSATNINQSAYFYDPLGVYSNHSNIYVVREPYMDENAQMNANNSEDEEEDSSKKAVIITEVSDEDEELDDDIGINIKSRAKKKDYVDAISLNEECDNSIITNN
jgi:hypothetical protein